MTSTSRTRSRSSRRLAGTAVVGTAAVALGAQAVHAATATDASTSYTGCLRTSGDQAGRLFAVKVGQDPTRPCSGTEQPLRIAGGDLTGFSVGTGLSDLSPEKNLGITARGDVRVELAPSYRLPQNCGIDLTTRWNGSSWVCATPAPAARPLVFDAGSESDEVGREVGNDWAVLGGFDVPAGSWKFTSRVHHFDRDGDIGAFIDCRIDVTGAQYRDRARHSDPEPYNDGWLNLSAYHSSSTPFRVATLCRDSRTGKPENETGMQWYSLHMTADPSQPVVRLQ